MGELTKKHSELLKYGREMRRTEKNVDKTTSLKRCQTKNWTSGRWNVLYLYFYGSMS